MIRAKIIAFILAFLFALLLLGLFNLSLLQGAKYKGLSDRNSVRLIAQAGARGKILDRTGNILADNVLSYDVAVSPQEAGKPEIILREIARVITIDYEALMREYKNNYIAQSVPVTVCRNVDLKKAIILEQHKLDMPGVLIQARPVRHYPHGKLACHVLGYVNEIDRWRLTKLADYGYKTKDMVGFGGVEEKYDYYLRQEEGGLSVEVNHRGRLVRVLGFQPAHNGRDIQLTLDLRIQKIAEDKLGGRKGSVIMMDPNTGEIIAMASSPGFDPSVFTGGSRSLITRLLSESGAAFMNRGTSCSYPAGSVFKVIVAACALETKKINLNTSFLCQGAALVGRQKFACWDVHGWQDLISAITHSCNIFFYKAGLLSGPQQIHDYALKLGLGRPVSFDLPYEAGGFIPSPLWRKLSKFQNWFDGDTVNLSIGQGDVLVTPLQIARMMSVFANKGHLVAPFIVKEIDTQQVYLARRKAIYLNLKENTIDFIRKGLRNAVSEQGGTANIMADLSVSVAGKTGTAQAPPGQPHAWFAGFFPFKSPKFVICVLIERGGSGHFAAVIARQIIEEMAAEGLI